MGVRKFHTVRVTPVCHTGAVNSGSIIFQGTKLPSICPKNGSSRLIGVTAIWYADQASASIELVFSQKSLTLGTLANAVSVTDGDLKDAVPIGNMYVNGVADGATGDLINSRITTSGYSGASAKSTVLHAGPDEDDGAVYVAGINRASGAITYTAGTMDLIFAVEVL